MSKRMRRSWASVRSDALLIIPPVLDQDFDYEDELVLDEPPLMAVLGDMAWRLKPIPEDDN